MQDHQKPRSRHFDSRAALRVLTVSLGLLSLSGVSLAETSRRERWAGPRALAKFLDGRFEALQSAGKLEPAPVISNERLMRRLSLDALGVVPQPESLMKWRGLSGADQTERLIDAVLARPEFEDRLADALARAWVGTVSEREIAGRRQQIKGWISEDLGADEMARRWILEGQRAGFGDLDEQIANTARAFQGASIGCAQCHDHPFAKWKQEQFHEFAAYFTGGQRNVELRGLNTKILARFPFTESLPEPPLVVDEERSSPDGKPLKRAMRPIERAAWFVTHPENPRFREVVVNQLWEVFFGVPLVGPRDDLEQANDGSNRLLLQLLGEFFARSKFSLRPLVRAITLTRAYRRESRRPSSQYDPAKTLLERIKKGASSEAIAEARAQVQLEEESFARARLRPLGARVIVTSMLRVTGIEPLNVPGLTKRGSQGLDWSRYEARRAQLIYEMEVEFDEKSESVEHYGGSVRQSLVLLNGEFLNEAIQNSPGSMLRQILSSSTEAEGVIRRCYRAVLCREPESGELRALTGLFHSARRFDEAAADLMWALINSAEFQFNH